MKNLRVSYKRHRFPQQIIAHAVWLYFRFPLSLRVVEELLLERGIVVSYETIRRWGRKFGPAYAKQIRRRRPSHQDVWHLDEGFCRNSNLRRGRLLLSLYAARISNCWASDGAGL